jgi:hypothetical protein
MIDSIVKPHWVGLDHSPMEMLTARVDEFSGKSKVHLDSLIKILIEQ